MKLIWQVYLASNAEGTMHYVFVSSVNGKEISLLYDPSYSQLRKCDERNGPERFACRDDYLVLKGYIIDEDMMELEQLCSEYCRQIPEGGSMAEWAQRALDDALDRRLIR